MMSLGTGLAFLGAVLAVGLACAGSGRGVGLAGEAGSGVIAEDPSRFAQCLILEIIPGTQGLYGLVIWFFAMMEQAFQNALQALEQLDGARREKLCLALARTVVSPEEEGEVLLFPEDRDTVGAAFTAQYPKLRIAKENCGALGFLLRFGAVEVDCTFRSVLEELREPLAARVAQALVGEAHADEG